MMFRTIVVDDEAPARRGLRRLLEPHHEVAVIGEADCGEEAVRMIADQQPDLVLLDIQLPNYDAFEVLRRSTAVPLVIFTTAHDEYALRAFEAASIDYLLKPIEPDMLGRALTKLKRLTQAGERDEVGKQLQDLVKSWQPPTAPPQYAHRMAVQVGERSLLVDLRDVTHFAAKDKYVFLHLAAGKEYIVDHTVADLERRLNPQKFVRVHRSVIVNIDHVKEIQKWFGGKRRLLLDDAGASEIVVSKTMAPNLDAALPL
jgi:two-component system, LytTR family, response regulator